MLSVILCAAFFCVPLCLVHFQYWSNICLMRIAKPLLLITTPIGVLGGFYECYKLVGGLLFLMVAMVSVLVAAFGTVIATIRREERESKARVL
jgi:hypothetical protein